MKTAWLLLLALAASAAQAQGGFGEEMGRLACAQGNLAMCGQFGGPPPARPPPPPPQSGIMGFLVNYQIVTTVTGQQGFACTYVVMGQRVTVTLGELCPPAMSFN